MAFSFKLLKLNSSEVKKVKLGQHLKAFHPDVPAILIMFIYLSPFSPKRVKVSQVCCWMMVGSEVEREVG